MRLLLFLFLPPIVFPSNSTDDQQQQEQQQSYVVDSYLPLLLFINSLSSNDSLLMQQFVEQKNYARLKAHIDQKHKVPDVEVLDLMTSSETNYSTLLNTTNDEDMATSLQILEAYHNASIYSIIRNIWASVVDPVIPAIDQLAILEYFSERKEMEVVQMGFWTRIWYSLKTWFHGKEAFIGCYADRPRCVRSVVEQLPMESRIELEKAAEEENCLEVDKMINNELETNYSPEEKEELDNWKQENRVPASLLFLVGNISEAEKISLDRLRRHNLLHSLKDYYRAMIESRPIPEQQELQKYFKQMNTSFAQCFNPAKSRYEYL